MPEQWHWFYLHHMGGVSLYADPGSHKNEAVIQLCLPGFADVLFASIDEVINMKGVWSGSKNTDASYRPGIDALTAVDSALLASAILSAVEHGCALMFGATRDGGAVALTLLDGNERHKLYPQNVQELNQALRDLIESLAPEVKPTPRGGSKR